MPVKTFRLSILSVMILLGGFSGADVPDGRLPATGMKSGTLPNVVFVVIDAWCADRLDATRNGQALMPHLSSLASGSVRFTDVIAPCSWTRPSMASILTSLLVEAHETSYATDQLAAGVETMAEFMKGAGYTTIGVQTNGNLTEELGFTQGFDVYDYDASTERIASEVTTAALGHLSGVTTPFFCYVHYLDPHMLYTPPDTYKTLLGYPNLGLTPEEQAIAEYFLPYAQDQNDFTLGIKASRDYTELSSIGKEAVRILYDGEVRYADEELYRFLNTVETEYPDTIIIVTSDHGEHFWEHDLLGHGLSLYQPLLRVPLLVKAPGLSAATVATRVTTLDILPTIAGLLGLAPRTQWQGRSLFAAADASRALFSNTRGGTGLRELNLESVIQGDLKLIHNCKNAEMAMYNIATDPGETVDLVSTDSSAATQLMSLLDAQREANYRARIRTASITRSPNRWIQEGDALRLTAPTAASYQWKKDGASIAGATTITLTLSPVCLLDSGTYECEYDDGTRGFRYTKPYVLDVLAAHSVPAGTGYGWGVLSLLLGCAGAFFCLPRPLRTA